MNTVKTEMIRDAKKSVGGSSFMTTVEVAAWRHEDRRTVERKFKRCGIEKPIRKTEMSPIKKS